MWQLMEKLKDFLALARYSQKILFRLSLQNIKGFFFFFFFPCSMVTSEYQEKLCILHFEFARFRSTALQFARPKFSDLHGEYVVFF